MKLLPDILSIIGLALLGYGLFLYSPRISFCVIGALLLVYGVAVDIVRSRGGGA